MNDINSLVKLISDYYNDKEYEKANFLIDKYLSNKDYGVYAKLLDMKMNCLINLGRFQEASSILTLINKIYPGVNYPNYNAYNYIICNEIEKALQILLDSPYNAEIAFNLGKVYMLMGEYKKALEHYRYVIEHHQVLSYQDKARDELEKINNYNKFCAYIPRDYKYFKKNGGRLRIGDVIYTNSVSYNINAEYVRSEKSIPRKPFLIWKMLGQKIYAFPLTLKRNDIGVLKGQNYANVGVNRYFVPNLVMISEEDVHRIYDHIGHRDFENMIRNIYRSIVCDGEDAINRNNIFVNSIHQNYNVNIGDIVSYYDKEGKSINNYYIIGKNEEDYLAAQIMLENNVWNVISDISFISKSNYIYNLYQIDDRTKESIDKQLSNKVLRKNRI